MQVIQHRVAQSYYGGAGYTQLPDLNARSVNDNELWVGRSRTSPNCSYDEPSPRRKHERNKEDVSKPPPHTSQWKNHELKRKRRVATYRWYMAEGKAKSSLKNRFHSFKIICMKIVTSH